MLKVLLSLLYFGISYKIIDYLFYRSSLPVGLLANCLELLCLGLALAGSIALAVFTANKIKGRSWFEDGASTGD